MYGYHRDIISMLKRWMIPYVSNHRERVNGDVQGKKPPKLVTRCRHLLEYSRSPQPLYRSCNFVNPRFKVGVDLSIATWQRVAVGSWLRLNFCLITIGVCEKKNLPKSFINSLFNCNDFDSKFNYFLFEVHLFSKLGTIYTIRLSYTMVYLGECD